MGLMCFFSGRMGNGDGEMEEDAVTRKAVGLGFHDGCE